MWNGAKESNVIIKLPRKFCIGGVAFKSVCAYDSGGDPKGVTVSYNCGDSTNLEPSWKTIGRYKLDYKDRRNHSIRFNFEQSIIASELRFAL